MRHLMPTVGSVPVWLALAAALSGFAVGRAGPGEAAVAAQSLPVASPVAECVPPGPTAVPLPTPTPTPVPPAAMNAPLPYPGGWEIAVKDATTATAVETETPTGVFVRVVLAVTNTGTGARYFPITDFVLSDGQNRVFSLAVGATGYAVAGSGLGRPPGGPTDMVVVFDVPTDAAQPFVLESTADPTFRVRVALAVRG